MPSIKCRKCYFTVALDQWTNASLSAFQGTIQWCHGLVNLHSDEKRGLISGNQLSRVYFQRNKSKCLNIFRTAHQRTFKEPFNDNNEHFRDTSCVKNSSKWKYLIKHHPFDKEKVYHTGKIHHTYEINLCYKT